MHLKVTMYERAKTKNDNKFASLTARRSSSALDLRFRDCGDNTVGVG